MDALLFALLVVLAITNGIAAIELALHRRTVKEWIERGYENGEDD